MSDSFLVRLIVGHETELLEKPTDKNHTHRWKVFVRPPPDCPPFTDRSFIKKVTFYLHSSFENPKRSIRNPPFEVEETGYGGFDMLIHIVFNHLAKQFPINYDITLPMDKTSKSYVENLLEVKSPPPEFIELALKYGGRRHDNSIPDKIEKLKIFHDEDKKKKAEKDKKHSKDKERALGSDKDKEKPRDKEKDHKKIKDKEREMNDTKEKIRDKEHRHKDDKEKVRIKEKYKEEKKRDMHEIKETPEIKSKDVCVKDEMRETKEKGKEKNKDISSKSDIRIQKSTKRQESSKSLLSVDALFDPVGEKPIKEEPHRVKDVVDKESKKSKEIKKMKSKKHEDEPIEKKQKTLPDSSNQVLVDINELSKMPTILSPLPRLEDCGPLTLPVLTPHSSHHEESELSLQIEDMKRRLFIKVDPEEYKCPLLQYIGLSPEQIIKYERRVPLFTYNDMYPDGDRYDTFDIVEEKH